MSVFKPFIHVEVKAPIRCTFHFPFIVTYPERYTRLIKVADGIFYTDISDYYFVVRELEKAPKNPKNIEWTNQVIAPLGVKIIGSEKTVCTYKVENIYEYASFLYRVGSELEYKNIVVLTAYPREYYTVALGEFVKASEDTLLVVHITELFKAGHLGLEMLLPIYALVLDPSLTKTLRNVLDEVYGYFGAVRVFDVYAPTTDILINMPLRLSEMRRISPVRAIYFSKRELALKRILEDKAVRQILFDESKILI